jgi:hypothetical protein
VHPVIQSAVAAQHVKDMLDRAAQENRVREARRSRPGRRWRRHAGVAATSVAPTPAAATPVAAKPVAAKPVAATPVAATPVAAMAGAANRGAAATQCCPD